MRLLSTREATQGEAELRLHECFGTGIPKYAILSHTWAADASEEVQYSDTLNGAYAGKSGLRKVHGAIQQARRDGHDYIWIDSICIDRSSSAELSEAINSMFRWYQLSEICYVYLTDVDDPVANDSVYDPDARFSQARWWSRGWTLQELIAPRRLQFYSSHWVLLGDKNTLQNYITGITTIESRFLNSTAAVEASSVAKRMSWAASRTTTREEDMAYCLLGIFSVNMPMLYGEGSRAFMRLQEEIIKMSNDCSIFAWRDKTHAASHGLLADHPRAFAYSGSIVPFFGWQGRKPFGMTNMGLDIELPLVEGEGGWGNQDTRQLVYTNTQTARPFEPIFKVAIACRAPELPDKYLALELRALPGKPNSYTRVNCESLQSLDVAPPPMKLYIPQNITISRWQLEVPVHRGVLLQSYENNVNWTMETSSRNNKSFHNIHSSGVIRQYDSHMLPDRNSILQRLSSFQGAESIHRIFIVGQARNRIYGWVVFSRASDRMVIMILVGRLLNGEIGFGILRLNDKNHETTEFSAHTLQPAGCWIDMNFPRTSQTLVGASQPATRAKFDATLQLTSAENVFDIDVQTVDLQHEDRSRRPVDIAKFISSRTRTIAQKAFSW